MFFIYVFHQFYIVFCDKKAELRIFLQNLLRNLEGKFIPIRENQMKLRGIHMLIFY